MAKAPRLVALWSAHSMEWVAVLSLLLVTASQATQLSGTFGEFSSPGHPLAYPALTSQTWDISAPGGYIIKLYVPYLDIELSDGCQSSFLQVQSQGEQLARLCGRWKGEQEDPALQEYYSSTNSMRVLFQANSSSSRPFSGFLALYSRVDINECELGAHGCSHYCGNTIGGHRCYCPIGFKLQGDGRTCKRQDAVCSALALANGVATPRWKAFHPHDRVKVTCKPGYEIVEGFKTIPHYFMECQKNGTWSTSGYKCQPVDCGSPPAIENGQFTYLSGSGVTSYQSLIQYQCNEPYYEMDPDSQRDFTCTEVGMWKNNKTGQVLPHCSAVCGRPSNPVTFRERVLRGSVAKRGNFPWLVRFGGVQGAGALLSERWVLTAAHVVHDLREHSLFAGFTDLRRRDQAQRLSADRIFIHQGYQQSLLDGVHNYDNDIALVRLRSPVTLGPDVSPICLPERAQSGPLLRQMGLVAGWGVTENNTLPAELMYTRLPVLDLDRCRQTVAQDPVTVTNNMICAGEVAVEEGGVGSDTCQGDSGGAFVFPFPKPRNDRFYVGGIVSWGVKCGTVGFYTKVVNYLDWIEQIMEKNSVDCGSPPAIENGQFTYLSGSGVTSYQSLIQYQCNEPYCEMDPDSQPLHHKFHFDSSPFVFAIKVLKCLEPVGKCEGKSLSCFFIFQQVLRSSVARRNNFPWLVRFHQVHAAGSLLSERWVLTAARAVLNLRELGLSQLRWLGRARLLSADRIFVHPGYQRAQSGPRPRQSGLVAGWGATENNTLPAELMYTRLPVLDLEKCRRLVAQLPVTVSDNLTCAGSAEGLEGDGVGSETLCQGHGIRLNIKQPSLSPVLSVPNAAGDLGYSDIMGRRLVAFRNFLVLIALSPAVSGSDDPGLFGEIRLPNYHPGERLSWEVAVSPGFGLRLQLQHYDSERSSPCRKNYVEVYADRERLGRFCGNTTSSRFHRPFPSASTADQHTVCLRVRSHSANRESRRGFSVSYEAVDIDECGDRWEGQAACQHFCHNYIGGYRCYCRQGYSLHGDGKTCQVTQCGVPEDIENGSYEYLDDEAGTRTGSVISYRCRQTYYTMVGGADGTYSCRDNGKWENSVVGETLPSCKPVCGKPQQPPVLIQRIFGGAPARDGNFPWQVYFENRVCGGALLSDAWVLTSASCVEGELRPQMFAGATDRNSAAGWTALEGMEVHVHPGYAQSPVGHDIALVRLQETARMGPTMSPICLPRDEVEVGTVGLVSGFGETEHFSQSEVLMFAPVPVVERNNCQAPIPLTPTVICAGTGGGADACTGDGGGSLVFKDPLHHDTYFTAGVVSWGQKCGEYGVYTSVRNHLEWIENIMGP
ncbi:uncharacterized protein [Mobula birostris]|uniref:uncharacterized protein n=1 Tax=Mobula birostris TaxID=1983395 RepID=UPI003B27D889